MTGTDERWQFLQQKIAQVNDVLGIIFLHQCRRDSNEKFQYVLDVNALNVTGQWTMLQQNAQSFFRLIQFAKNRGKITFAKLWGNRH